VVLGPQPRRASPRALTTVEHQTVLDVLHAPRFIDLAPAQVYATLLDVSRAGAHRRTKPPCGMSCCGTEFAKIGRPETACPSEAVAFTPMGETCSCQN
jgi:hypothetical protein